MAVKYSFEILWWLSELLSSSVRIIVVKRTMSRISALISSFNLSLPAFWICWSGRGVRQLGEEVGEVKFEGG